AGLEVAMVFSLVGAIVAEFVGAEAGLGMLIQSRNFTMDVAGEFAVLLILAVVGPALHALLVAVRRPLLFLDTSQKALTNGASTKARCVSDQQIAQPIRETTKGTSMRVGL